LAVVLFHLLFLGLVNVTVMPTLPASLNIADILLNKPLGYFPMALASANFPLQKLGNYLSFVFYLAIVLSGLQHLLGAANSTLRAVRAVLPGLKLFSGLVATGVGLGVTIPLCFSTGSSLLAVVERYGSMLPCLALGWAEVILVFWYYGAGKLVRRIPGSLVINKTLHSTA
jgi:hypothetical protein